MIYFVSLQDHFKGIRRLLAGIKPELKTLRHISYEQLFRGWQAPVGHYVFTDLDRLSHYEREAAIALTDALREVDPALHILNDPRNVLDRYPLLRLLEQRGLNRFSVTRLDDGTRPERYPVFVRCEDDHYGADTELLHSAEELERAISELRAQGRVLKRRIAVEFCAKKGGDGLYRKYGAINIDGRIIPQHLFHSEHWQIKTRTSLDFHGAGFA